MKRAFDSWCVSTPRLDFRCQVRFLSFTSEPVYKINIV